MESQHKTENRPTTTIVVAIRKCSITQRKYRGNPPASDEPEGEQKTQSGKQCGELAEHPAGIRIGRQQLQIDNAHQERAIEHAKLTLFDSRCLRMDEVRDLLRDCHRVLLDGELRKDTFESWQRHQCPQPFDRVVGHDLAAMQNDDMRADALDGLQFVRAEENDLAARCKLLNQAPQNKGRTDIEPERARPARRDRDCAAAPPPADIFWRMPFEYAEIAT